MREEQRPGHGLPEAGGLPWRKGVNWNLLAEERDRGGNLAGRASAHAQTRAGSGVDAERSVSDELRGLPRPHQCRLADDLPRHAHQLDPRNAGRAAVERGLYLPVGDGGRLHLQGVLRDGVRTHPDHAQGPPKRHRQGESKAHLPQKVVKADAHGRFQARVHPDLAGPRPVQPAQRHREVYQLDCGGQTAERAAKVPETAHHLIPVPCGAKNEGPGGLIIACEGQLIYKK